MQRKTFSLIETKAEGDGTFTALASVFGNVDLVGDRMMPGSFTKTLDAWRKSGDPIPVILSHQWDDPFALIGKADPRAVMETERGLLVQGQMDMDNEVARQVHKLMRERLLKGWSFGYTVPDGGQKRNDGANEVTEVDLIEVGPTLKGANPEAQLEAVKAIDHVTPKQTAARLDALVDDLRSDSPPAEAEILERLASVKAMIQTVPDFITTSPDVPAIEDAGEEPETAKPKAQDPHRRDLYDLTVEGIDVEPPQVKEEPPTAEDPLDVAALRRRYYDLMLETIS